MCDLKKEEKYRTILSRLYYDNIDFSVVEEMVALKQEKLPELERQIEAVREAGFDKCPIQKVDSRDKGPYWFRGYDSVSKQLIIARVEENGSRRYEYYDLVDAISFLVGQYSFKNQVPDS